MLWKWTFLPIAKKPHFVESVDFGSQPQDLFAAFKEMVQANGGFFETSSNPLSSFRKAMEAAENYYLLYYTPKNYTSDRKFKNIKVKVKNKGYRILHRAGYFSN